MQRKITSPVQNEIDATSELSRLLTPGMVGFYNFFEVTEIVAFVEKAKRPVNVLTVAVAQERTAELTEGCRFLNETRIEIKSLKGWKFGVARYSRPIAQLNAVLPAVTAQHVWRASGEDLQLGSLTALSPKFVPPDGLVAVPLNRVLKNNFWNGSYVFEWADPSKELLKPFFEEAQRLQELSDAVNGYVPMGVGALSDRLGNILLQIPVTVMTADFIAPQRTGGLVLKIAWHPNAAPRPLMVTCERCSDDLISAFAPVRVTEAETSIPILSDEGQYRATLWDEAEKILLGATGEFGFITSIPLKMGIESYKKRSFVIKDPQGQDTRHEVGIIEGQSMMIGTPNVGPNGSFTRERMYNQEVSRLVAQRRFVQYATEGGDSTAERTRALADIRRLINEHGDAGAWLWDPFLSAHDVLETLFFCSHRNVDLRALTSGKEPPGTPSLQDFVAGQQSVFADAGTKFEGLRLEFRRKYGPKGQAFHDRFLIFPRSLDHATRAWSLGTSINGVGMEHHILQQVDNGQAVMDAFLELWNALTAPEHLIWKAP